MKTINLDWIKTLRSLTRETLSIMIIVAIKHAKVNESLSPSTEIGLPTAGAYHNHTVILVKAYG